MTNILAATAHIGIVINTPSNIDDFERFLKVIIAFIVFLILAWEKLEVAFVFASAMWESIMVAYKLMSIVINTIRFVL